MLYYKNALLNTFFYLDSFFRRINNRVLINNLFLVLLYELRYFKSFSPYISYYFQLQILLHFYLLIIF